jgi:hypothetical protein
MTYVVAVVLSLAVGILAGFMLQAVASMMCDVRCSALLPGLFGGCWPHACGPLTAGLEQPRTTTAAPTSW